MDYIKLSRKITEWEWYRSKNTKIVFIHLLLSANWKEGRFEGQTIPRGSCVVSINSLAADLSLSKQAVRTALNHLSATGEINMRTTNKYTIITVNNYERYQATKSADGNSQKIESQSVTSKEKPIEKTIEKQIKKSSNSKTKAATKSYFPDDEKLNKAFCDYAEMRKQIKHPLTPRAVELAKARLDKLSQGDRDNSIAILEQSVFRGWQGLFAVKETDDSNNNTYKDWEKS